MNADSFRFDDEGPSKARQVPVSRRSLGHWLGRHWGVLALLALTAVAVGLVAAYLRPPSTPPVVVYQPTSRPTSSPPPMTQIVVHVGGAVTNPGLYRLPVGSRIDDAIKLAGGALPEADLNRLNLAARLSDGQQVMVLTRHAAASPMIAPGVGTGPSATGRINVNTASIPELDGLPGVGPVTAQRIVAYREQHGPFARIEQLREAKLVNNATFEKIKDLVIAE